VDDATETFPYGCGSPVRRGGTGRIGAVLNLQPVRVVAAADHAAAVGQGVKRLGGVGLAFNSGQRGSRCAVPFGVSLASSIVQDGHGMLLMLAHSRRAFVTVKGVNVPLGLAAGAVTMGLDM